MKIETVNSMADHRLSPPIRNSSPMGLVALAAEALAFVLIKFFEMGAWSILPRPTPDLLGYRLFVSCFGLFLLSAPLAFIGILVDRKKGFGRLVLATFLPALAFLVVGSGYW